MYLNVFSFNCKGINSCFNNVLHEIKNFSDVMFLCEHWLYPYELATTNQLFQNENLISFLKSSIDPEELLRGRPFGGVGLVCKKLDNLRYRQIEIDNDRLIAVKVIDKNSGKALLNIIGAYLPYFTGCVDQTTLFVDVLDQLQSVIDDCSDAPVMLVGDMNTNLPQQHSLPRRWYRCHPFNQHSNILYDFLCNNDLIIANFSFDQDVNYTYEMGNSRSYIDHVFVSSYSCQNVTKSQIVSNDTEWASDHLPLRTQYRLCVNNFNNCPSINLQEDTEQAVRFPRVNWEKEGVRNEYQQHINQEIGDVKDFNNQLANIADCKGAEKFVNSYLDLLVNTMHNSCKNMNERKTHMPKGRRVPWWSNDCTIARDKTRFWHKLWIKCDRSRNTQVFYIYKHVKKVYRNVRRKTMYTFHRRNFDVLTDLFKHGDSKKFWNRVRISKARGNSNSSDIDITSLRGFFTEKFSTCNSPKSQSVNHAESFVKDKYCTLKNTVYRSKRFNTSVILKFIKKLKSARAPGFDGITPEHLKYSTGTKIPEMLAGIFNTCINFGIIPESLKIGVLIPILKKPSLDSTVAGNYRPIILSSVISKILEYAILEDVSSHEFCDLQYGFIEGRSAQMAICNTIDVIKYFNNRGTPVFACSLDAEKAFDAIPHSILLYKASSVLKNHWWRLMFSWYTSLTATVKWNNKLSKSFNLYKGTRQGGLTSPFLFNLLYQELVNGLSDLPGGMKIGNLSYNVFCYADDLLLTSATATGLQKLINFANTYVSSHGLSFNAKKSNTIVFGKCYLQPYPTWSINDCTISNVNEIDYLGAVLSNNCQNHVNRRIRKCRQAFYSLQGAGMCNNGVKPDVISYLWQTALQSIMLYSDECFDMRNTLLLDLEKLQGKLIKSSLGLSKYLRSSPLLAALGVRKIECLIQCQSVKLFNSIVLSKTRASNLYMHSLIRNNQIGLLNRVKEICLKNELSLARVCTDRLYCKKVCNKLKLLPRNDGVVDSCKALLNNFNEENKEMLKLLLRAF